MFRIKGYTTKLSNHQLIIHSRKPEFDGTLSATRSPFEIALRDDVPRRSRTFVVQASAQQDLIDR